MSRTTFGKASLICGALVAAGGAGAAACTPIPHYTVTTDAATDAAMTDGQAPDASDGGAGDADASPRPNYVFVTSATHRPDFGGLPEGDFICQAAAGEGLADVQKGHWRAWLSTETQGAATRLAAAFPGGVLPAFALPDGTPVFPAGVDFKTPVRYPDGGTGPTLPLNPIAIDELGHPVTSSPHVWTATTVFGAPVGMGLSCNEWGSSGPLTPNNHGAPGDTRSAGEGWTTGTIVLCDDVARLYCFQVP